MLSLQIVNFRSSLHNGHLQDVLGNACAFCIVHGLFYDVSTTLPAYAITPVDTTSCGDSYCAGFIAALSRGWAPLDAARFGTATAALVAQGLATLGKVESFEATEAAMRQMTLSEAA